MSVKDKVFTCSMSFVLVGAIAPPGLILLALAVAMMAWVNWCSE